MDLLVVEALIHCFCTSPWSYALESTWSATHKAPFTHQFDCADTVILSKNKLQEKDPELFHMARVGLGCLGVVAELTIQCVPSHQLLQHTQVMSRQQVHQQHKQLLQNNRHLRYMWLPYTDAVVVVTCNPHKEVSLCYWTTVLGTSPFPRLPGDRPQPSQRGQLVLFIDDSLMNVILLYEPTLNGWR